MTHAEQLPEPPNDPGHVPAEELPRLGVRPLTSAQDLTEPGMFDSDEELYEFLAQLHASRRAGAWSHSWSELEQTSDSS